MASRYQDVSVDLDDYYTKTQTDDLLKNFYEELYPWPIGSITNNSFYLDKVYLSWSTASTIVYVYNDTPFEVEVVIKITVAVYSGSVGQTIRKTINHHSRSSYRLSSTTTNITVNSKTLKRIS